MKKILKSAVLSLFFLYTLSSTGFLYAHGGQKGPLTQEQISQIDLKEPLSEAPRFVDKVFNSGRGVLSSEDMEKLKEIYEYYEEYRRLTAPGSNPAFAGQAPYYRQIADDLLVEAIESIPPALTLDFTNYQFSLGPEEPISFNRINGIALLKVITGSDAQSFRHQIYDIDRERYNPPYTFEVHPNGVTWIVLEITGPSMQETVAGIAFKKDGEENPFGWHGLTIAEAAYGVLDLYLESNGKETPALIQVADSMNGNLWPIGDSISLKENMHDVTGPDELMPPGLSIRGPHESFHVKMPGNNQGFYWLVDSHTALTLPVGSWDITLLKGIEHEPVQLTVEIEEGNRQKRKVSFHRWEDMSHKGWFSGDDHIHSRMLHSGDVDKLVTFAKAMDIHVSNVLEMGDPQRTYFTQRGFGEEYYVESDGHWLIPGQEDPRSILGHNIGLNLTSLVRDRSKYLALDWIAREVHRQGGLFGQTHVGQNVCEAHRGMAILVPFELYDFYSIMQRGLGTELYYNFLDLGYKLNASAGSDTPYAGTVGDVRVYAHVGEDEELTPQKWFDALSTGKTFTTSGPMIEFTVNDQLPGSTIHTSNPDEEVRVEAKAWGLSGHSAPVGLEVVVLSEVAGRAVSAPDPGKDLSLSLSLNAGDGFWVAARAYGQNGSAAHTTPVYIKREGYRHWNVERAESVIDRQLDILDEIEAILDDVKKREKEGALNRLDFNNISVSREAETLKTLLNQSRGKYQELIEELKRQKGELE